jgi:GTP cyclohydrolase II
VDKGVVIYLRQEGRGIGLISKLKAYNLQDLLGLDTLEANTHLGFEADSRQYEAAVFILQSLGIRNVRLMTNNPEKMSALTHSGILVTERIPIEIAPNPENTNYLQTKKSIMGHLLKQGSFL